MDNQEFNFSDINSMQWNRTAIIDVDKPLPERDDDRNLSDSQPLSNKTINAIKELIKADTSSRGIDVNDVNLSVDFKPEAAQKLTVF